MDAGAYDIILDVSTSALVQSMDWIEFITFTIHPNVNSSYKEFNISVRVNEVGIIGPSVLP